MDYAFRVGKLQAPGGLQNIVHRLGHRKRAFRFDQGREVAPFHVFHYQEVNAVGFIRIVRGDNVRVAQLGGRLDLLAGIELPPRHLSWWPRAAS